MVTQWTAALRRRRKYSVNSSWSASCLDNVRPEETDFAHVIRRCAVTSLSASEAGRTGARVRGEEKHGPCLGRVHDQRDAV